ncbi:MAG: hypothetical protein ACFFCP_01430 [Promethearchaeota archaeon]
MDPIVTNRRHFFLLENWETETKEFEPLLLAAGFQRADPAQDVFSDNSAQILLQKSGSESDSFYICGAVTPDDKTIHNAKVTARRASYCGKLFFLSFVIYVILWIVAIAAVLMDLLILFIFLGPAIPFTYFAIAGFGAGTSILYFNLDSQVSKKNQKTAAHTWEVLIPLLQDQLEAQIQKLTIPTKLGARRIKAYIPPEISAKIERLDFGDIDAFFWD